MEVDEILTGIESDKEIFQHEKNMLLMDTPGNWNVNVKGNLEVEMEIEFEKMMFTVSEHTTEDINEITVFRFYSLIGFIKEKAQNNKKTK